MILFLLHFINSKMGAERLSDSPRIIANKNKDFKIHSLALLFKYNTHE